MKGPDATSEPNTHRFHDIRRLKETGSTNADALALAREGAAEGVVLVTDHQSAGRGRSGRRWEAPPGSALLCTVLLRPPAPVAPLVTFALAVAAADAVEAVAGFRPGLKWPNDLVVETTGDDGTTQTRKLAGILAEAEWPSGSNVSAGHRDPAPYSRVVVAAGIGLNVAWPEEAPEDLVDIAVAINHLTDRVVSVDAVLEALLVRLDGWYSKLVGGDSAAVLDAWRERSSTLGRRVRIDLGPDDVVGTAVDITASGQLIVDSVDGTRRVLAVGDVVHLRPA